MNTSILRFIAILSFLGSFLPSVNAADCDKNTADSTCFSETNPALCSFSSIKQPNSCPSGLFGVGMQEGQHNLCTGDINWDSSSQDLTHCTDCTAPLSDDETKAVQNAILESLESVNVAFNNYVCPDFNCLDGTIITNPLTNLPAGVSFRDHVWVPDAYSTNLLPTSYRMNYLGDNNLIPSFIPDMPFLPKDYQNHSITDTRKLYLMGFQGAVNGKYTQCTGDSTNGCITQCTMPTAGFMDQFCSISTVEYYVCSDGPAVFKETTSKWQPTSAMTAPYTDHGNYSSKDWDLDTVFGWNGLPSNGGSVFNCNSTFKTCTGWATSNVYYSCKTPGSGPCPGNPANTCTGCEYADAVWDWNLYQNNDCPMTASSTRSANSRMIWQSDFPSQCNSAPLAPPSTPGTCPPGMVLDGSGSSCACPSGFIADPSNGTCTATSGPGAPNYSKKISEIPRNYPMAHVNIGNFSNTSVNINNIQLVGGSLPSGLSISFNGYQVYVNGTTSSSSGNYSGSIAISYDAGSTYPAGVTLESFTINVVSYDKPCRYKKTQVAAATTYNLMDYNDVITDFEAIGQFTSCNDVSNFTCTISKMAQLGGYDVSATCKCATGYSFNGSTCDLSN